MGNRKTASGSMTIETGISFHLLVLQQPVSRSFSLFSRNLVLLTCLLYLHPLLTGHSLHWARLLEWFTRCHILQALREASRTLSIHSLQQLQKKEPHRQSHLRLQPLLMHLSLVTFPCWMSICLDSRSISRRRSKICFHTYNSKNGCHLWNPIERRNFEASI